MIIAFIDNGGVPSFLKSIKKIYAKTLRRFLLEQIQSTLPMWYLLCRCILEALSTNMWFEGEYNRIH